MILLPNDNDMINDNDDDKNDILSKDNTTHTADNN